MMPKPAPKADLTARLDRHWSHYEWSVNTTFLEPGPICGAPGQFGARYLLTEQFFRPLRGVAFDNFADSGSHLDTAFVSTHVIEPARACRPTKRGHKRESWIRTREDESARGGGGGTVALPTRTNGAVGRGASSRKIVVRPCQDRKPSPPGPARPRPPRPGPTTCMPAGPPCTVHAAHCLVCTDAWIPGNRA